MSWFMLTSCVFFSVITTILAMHDPSLTRILMTGTAYFGAGLWLSELYHNS